MPFGRIGKVLVVQITIDGVHNPRIKKVAALQQKKYREETGLFLVEGVRAVEEAMAHAAVEELYFTDSALHDRKEHLIGQAENKGLPVYRVSAAVFRKMADTDSPQGVLAVVRKPRRSFTDLWQHPHPFLILVDGLADPGNLGTIIRTADAAGAAGIILLSGTVDVYNPKVVRSTAGSLFHIPVIDGMDTREVLAQLKHRGVTVLAADVGATEPYYAVDLTAAVAVAIGNEGAGLSAPVVEAADRRVKIPMPGKAESLNAAMACGIILYEGLRQRALKESTRNL